MRCVIDTETTGLPNMQWARVIEIAAVVIDDDGREVAAFQSLIYPDILDERCDRALAYCGLTRQDLSIASAPDVVREDFRRWCEEMHVDAVWAYNRSFDEGMLLRSGFQLPWAGCVMREARARMPRRKKDPPLYEAALWFLGEEPARSHQALDDARTAARVLAAMMRVDHAAQLSSPTHPRW